jgi:hypothetical protein
MVRIPLFGYAATASEPPPDPNVTEAGDSTARAALVKSTLT